MSLIPERLVERRKAVRLTQEQLAKKLGIKVSMLRRWERGSGAPNGAAFGSLCEVVDTNFFYLTGDGAHHRFLGPLSAAEVQTILDSRDLLRDRQRVMEMLKV